MDKALDNIVSAFKDLANKYNNTMSFLSNNVERGSGISAQMEAFKRMMPHEKTLNALGMGYDKNGKVTFDEDTFRENWEKDPNQIKDLMGGQFGIAERVGSKATAVLDSSVDKVIGSEEGAATGAISTQEAVPTQIRPLPLPSHPRCRNPLCSLLVLQGAARLI